MPGLINLNLVKIVILVRNFGGLLVLLKTTLITQFKVFLMSLLNSYETEQYLNNIGELDRPHDSQPCNTPRVFAFSFHYLYTDQDHLFELLEKLHTGAAAKTVNEP